MIDGRKKEVQEERCDSNTPKKEYWHNRTQFSLIKCEL